MPHDSKIFESGLGFRHLALIDAFFAEGNNFSKVNAARTLGYNSAETYVDRLFKKPKIKAEIERRFLERRQKVEINEEWVLEKLVTLIEANTGDIIMKLRESHGDLSVLTSEERYALAEVTEEIYMEGRGQSAVEVKKVKVKTESTLAAIMALMRHLGMFNDQLTLKHEVTLVERLQQGRERAMKQIEGEVIDVT